MIKSEYDVVSKDYNEIELSDKEIEERNAKGKAIDAAKAAAIKAEANNAAAKASAQVKLAALGLTDDEVKAIVGN